MYRICFATLGLCTSQRFTMKRAPLSRSLPALAKDMLMIPAAIEGPWQYVFTGWLSAIALNYSGVTASHLALASNMFFSVHTTDLEVYMYILHLHHNDPDYSSWRHHFFRDDKSSAKVAQIKDSNADDGANKGGKETPEKEEIESLRRQIADRDDRLLGAYLFIYEKALGEATYHFGHGRKGEKTPGICRIR